jgi:hypothetical protein
MSDLVPAPQRSSVVGGQEWTLINLQAERLATSDIIPVAYRRKPANIVVAALTGRTHGWDVLTAMRNGHVIEGVWGMKPEAMLGLVLAAGHRVDINRVDWGPILERGVEVVAHREGQEPVRVMYLVQHAVDEELVRLKDGKPFARSSNGKKLPWELYPVDMCQWRAVGRALRARYPDITLGIYTTDELGVSLADDGEVVEGEVEVAVSAAPAPLSGAALERFGEACATEGLDTAVVLGRAFPEGVPDPLTDAHLVPMRDAFHALIAELPEDRDPIVEGEVVDPEQVRPATRNQVGLVKARYERMAYDREGQLATTSAVIGRTVTTHNELNADEAAKVLAYLDSLEEPE